MVFNLKRVEQELPERVPQPGRLFVLTAATRWSVTAAARDSAQ